MTCIFDDIIARRIPSDIVYEDDKCLAFKDIHPVAPVHVLLIPKQCITQLSMAELSDQALLGHLMIKSAEVARLMNVEHAYRLVVNNGKQAGQSVFHLHLHIIGGELMGWPSI